MIRSSSGFGNITFQFLSWAVRIANEYHLSSAATEVFPATPGSTSTAAGTATSAATGTATTAAAEATSNRDGLVLHGHLNGLVLHLLGNSDGLVLHGLWNSDGLVLGWLGNGDGLVLYWWLVSDGLVLDWGLVSDLLDQRCLRNCNLLVGDGLHGNLLYGDLLDGDGLYSDGGGCTGSWGGCGITVRGPRGRG